MSWRNTILRKKSELELLSSWASCVGMGRVRDFCREAAAELDKELQSERCKIEEEIEKELG